MQTLINRLVRIRLWIFLFIPFTLGCSPHWHSSQTFYQPYSVVWDTCHAALAQHEYSVQKEDKGSGYIESKWQFCLYPFRRRSYRDRVILQITEAEKNEKNVKISDVDVEKFYQVNLYIFRERNHSHHDFLNSENGVWLFERYDTTKERLLVKTIESKIYLYEKEEKLKKKAKGPD